MWHKDCFEVFRKLGVGRVITDGHHEKLGNLPLRDVVSL